MKNDYSLETLSDFANDEDAELGLAGLDYTSNATPSEQVIQNILGFSKQLSVRPSMVLGRYEQNLN